MKNIFLLGALVLALVLTGCDAGEDEGGGTPEPVPGWSKLPGLTVQPGTTPGEIQYTISAAALVGSGFIDYTLYYIEGDVTSADDIRDEGIEKTNPSTSAPETISGLVPGRTYSFIVDASASGKTDVSSGVKTAVAKPVTPVANQKVMIIEGFNSSEVIAAVLYETDPRTGDVGWPDMIGVITTNGTFVFYEEDKDNAPYPNYSSPWNGTGDFYILLITAPDPTGMAYMYIDNGQIATRNFNETTVTIPWAQFYDIRN